eukprot:jgi/Bigna1/86322/estExt_fgenesh1_pg.C_90285
MSRDGGDDLVGTLYYWYTLLPSRAAVCRSISPYVPECFDVKICADPDIQAQNPLLAESDDNLEIKEDEGEEESSSSIISAQPTRNLRQTKKGLTGKAYRDALREKYGFEKKSRKKDSSGKNVSVIEHRMMMRKNVEDLNERGEALRNTENAAEERYPSSLFSPAHIANT